jgi:preprotein translocase subunit SecE
MAVTSDQEQSMAEIPPQGSGPAGRDDSAERALPPLSRTRGPAQSGFFTVYKPHQGTATRWGSAGGAALIILYSTISIYQMLSGQIVYLQDHKTTLYMIMGGYLAAMALLTFFVLNRPTYADFLIATDSEMKKVNWTSWAELIGSTKVIILFMFSIAAFLFFSDVFFGYVFYFLTILKTRPF